jgi:L-fuconolactonase
MAQSFLSRRRWLTASTAAAAGALLPRPAPAQGISEMKHPPTRIVDTHTHFYDPTRPQGVPWPPKNSKLYRKVMPEDWLSVSRPHGVIETVVVEASPWVEDNQWILDLAAREKSIVGFVGNLDPNDAQFEANVKRFAANPIFRGLRWRADLVRIDANKEVATRGAKLLAEHNLSLDLNGGPDLLLHAADLAAQVPDLRIIINHLGAPGDPKSMKPEWEANMRKAAAAPNIFMKVSALVEQVKCEEGKAPDDFEYYRPILDPLWDAFGPERLIYGSNWPVSDRGAPYAAVFKIVRDYFGTKDAGTLEKYFWKNALVAYKWTTRE